MAMSNAERQKRYRQSRKGGVRNELQLKVWIDITLSGALVRLAKHHGITQKAVLERLISEAEEQVLSGIETDSEAWCKYWGERYGHNDS